MKITIKRSGLLRQWRVRIFAKNGRQLFVSGDRYWNKADAIHAADLVRNNAFDSQLIIEGDPK